MTESQKEKMEWMANEVKVHVEGHPQLAGAGTGTLLLSFTITFSFI